VPREKAEKTLGAKFNIRALHDAVLKDGSMPPPVVTARTDRFFALPGYGVAVAGVADAGFPPFLTKIESVTIVPAT